MDPVLVLLRLLVPLTIFRFPLAGGLVSLLLDGADWHVNFFHIANLHAHYRQIDKILDLYYYSIEAYTVLAWSSLLAKKVAIGLYVWRGIGTFLVLLTQTAFFPIVFPNIFEGFFLLYLSCKALLGKEPRLPKPLVVGSVIVLAIPKIFQEYLMHVTHPWDWRYVRFVLPGGRIFTYDNVYHQIAIEVLLIIVCTVLLWKSKSKKAYVTKKRK